MNHPQYRQQYMNNLKQEIANNNKHLQANRQNVSSTATYQYITNTNQSIPGVSTFHYPPSQLPQIQPKGTKFNGFSHRHK